MKKKWIALCSAAIGAIYTAGYIATEAQASMQEPQQALTDSGTQNSQQTGQAQFIAQAQSQPTEQAQTGLPSKQPQVDTQTQMSQPQQPGQAVSLAPSSQAKQQVQTATQTQSNQPAQKKQVNTQTQSSQPTQQTQANTQTQSSQPAQQTQANTQTQSSRPAQQTQATAQTQSNQPKSVYKDGTYSGTGTNRRGSIQVAVTVKNDKITDVEISRFAMQYSEDDVVGLPKEVLQNQSAHVQNVSGATYSTQAFKDAVQNALTLARNA
jgi:uncharacterized protein with FMN-binding domain